MNLDALKARIRLLDISCAPAISEAERDYFRHYGINFEERRGDVTHYFGHLDCGRFDLVVHYFALSGAEKTCFVVHGYFDHSGLYKHVIEFCLQHNMAVVIFDLPGHGLSAGEPGAIASFQDYQVALQSVLDFFDGKTPSLWLAIGQSTGAAILMDFILSGGAAAFEKTVLLAPLYQPVAWRSAKLLHTLVYPWLRRLKRKFQPNSHDDEFLTFVETRDPLQAQYLSLEWVAALKQWIKHFDRLPATSCAPLIVQGKLDGTVDWRRNLPAIQKKFPNARVFYLQEGFHHLANERVDIRRKMFSAMDLYFVESRTQAN